MEQENRIIAIVGSARKDIMGEKEMEARLAAQAIGKELAKSNWRIAVYGSSTDYIEYDVVIGYADAGTNSTKSIICHYPYGVNVEFESMKTHNNYFDLQVDTNSDWEVSFYRSLAKVDAMLLFGGANSAFIAGQIALSRDLPVIAVAKFKGASQKIWKEHLSKKPGNIEEEDLQVMGRWVDNSPKEFVDSLNRQYQKRQKKLAEESAKIQEAISKAAKYDQIIAAEKSQKSNSVKAVVFLIAFLVCFIVGLAADKKISGWIYTTITVLGLCFAGGMGATIRMLAPNPPVTNNKWSGSLMGIIVGLVFTLIYLIPQLVQQSGFLIPSSMEDGITTAMRAQFVCSALVAVLAGIGFDYAIEQLIKKSHQDSENLIANKGQG